MAKRQRSDRRAKKRRKAGARRRIISAQPTSRTQRRRDVLIAVAGVAALAIVAVIVSVIVGRLRDTSADSLSDLEAVYHGIEGGLTDEGFPYLGSLESPVVLTEFTDLFCSHCRTYNLETEDSILADYVATGKVRYVLHYYSNGSSQSLQATDAAMCAADQGMYFQFQRAFFEEPAALRDDFDALARDLGLDVDDFMACWDAGRHRQALMAHIQSARVMGISATPSFLVNDRLVVGNRPDEVRQAIEDELARAAP